MSFSQKPNRAVSQLMNGCISRQKPGQGRHSPAPPLAGYPSYITSRLSANKEDLLSFLSCSIFPFLAHISKLQHHSIRCRVDTHHKYEHSEPRRGNVFPLAEHLLDMMAQLSRDTFLLSPPVTFCFNHLDVRGGGCN